MASQPKIEVYEGERLIGTIIGPIDRGAWGSFYMALYHPRPNCTVYLDPDGFRTEEEARAAIHAAAQNEAPR